MSEKKGLIMASDVEKQEIDSVAQLLFYGQIDESKIFPFPAMDDEQKSMAQEMTKAVNKFAQDNIDSVKFEAESHIPDEIFQGLAEMGVLGLAVEEQYGGLELNYTLYARVIAEIARFDGSLATMLGAHQSIGYRALINEGTDEQKKKWLPALASGEKLAAFCLTEPGSGSDAYSIKTKATKNADGTFTINGQKLWITNGGRADFYSVYCKTEHEVQGKTVEKISCFVVEKGMEGLSFGEPEKKMGISASETRAVFFDNVKVPAENLLGEYGKGFKVAMNVLNSGRLSLGSACLEGQKGILELATSHAKERRQFNRPISQFGMIQEKLSFMAANIYATESVTYFTTGLMDRGMDEYSVESAIIKIYSSETLWETVDMAMQIAGGTGYMKEYPYEKIMRDARINLIFEGTNEILRIYIALAGIKGPSEDLKQLGKVSDVSKVLQDPIKSVGILSNFAKKRIEKLIAAKTISKIHDDLGEWAAKFSIMLSDFSIKVENLLIKYGKSIIGNELPQKKIADMVISLYVMLATLSRTSMFLEDPNISKEKKDQVLGLCHIVCKRQRRVYMENYKGMDGKFDEVIKKVAKGVCDEDGRSFDIIYN